MITSMLQGGLGNQMFQIAAASALAWRNNDIAYFDLDNHHLPLQGRKALNYVENIFRNVQFKNNLEIKSVYREPFHHYTGIPYTPHTALMGYFQSEKYFNDYADAIRELFGADEKTKAYIFEKYGKLLNKKTVSIHVRRGDYLKFPNIHPVCAKEYYMSAMEQLPLDIEYLVFSDEPEWCLRNFPIGKFNVIKGEQDYVDLFLMSLCDHNIVANSSFSWWGAWLNNNPDKQVFAPQVWFGKKGPQDEQDMVPIDWVRI